MRFALIENNIVTNIVEAEQSFMDTFPIFSVNIGNMECRIGDTWDGTSFHFIDPEPLPDKRARIWNDIKMYRTLCLAGGYQYNGHWYYSDIPAKIELLGLQNKAIIQMINAGNLDDYIVIDGTNTQIKTIDNGYMELTFNDALNIALAGEVQTKRTYERAAIHKALLDASSDPDSYNWHTGWPETYTGA